MREQAVLAHGGLVPQLPHQAAAFPSLPGGEEPAGLGSVVVGGGGEPLSQSSFPGLVDLGLGRCLLLQ